MDIIPESSNSKNNLASSPAEKSSNKEGLPTTKDEKTAATPQRQMATTKTTTSFKRSPAAAATIKTTKVVNISNSVSSSTKSMTSVSKMKPIDKDKKPKTEQPSNVKEERGKQALNKIAVGSGFNKQSSPEIGSKHSFTKTKFIAKSETAGKSLSEDVKNAKIKPVTIVETAVSASSSSVVSSVTAVKAKNVLKLSGVGIKLPALSSRTTIAGLNVKSKSASANDNAKSSSSIVVKKSATPITTASTISKNNISIGTAKKLTTIAIEKKSLQSKNNPISAVASINSAVVASSSKPSTKINKPASTDKTKISAVASTHKTKISATSTDKIKISATSTDKTKISATSTDKTKISATSTDKTKISATTTDKTKISATSTDKTKKSVVSTIAVNRPPLNALSSSSSSKDVIKPIKQNNNGGKCSGDENNQFAIISSSTEFTKQCRPDNDVVTTALTTTNIDSSNSSDEEITSVALDETIIDTIRIIEPAIPTSKSTDSREQQHVDRPELDTNGTSENLVVVQIEDDTIGRYEQPDHQETVEDESNNDVMTENSIPISEEEGNLTEIDNKQRPKELDEDFLVNNEEPEAGDGLSSAAVETSSDFEYITKKEISDDALSSSSKEDRDGRKDVEDSSQTEDQQQQFVVNVDRDNFSTGNEGDDEEEYFKISISGSSDLELYGNDDDEIADDNDVKEEQEDKEDTIKIEDGSINCSYRNDENNYSSRDDSLEAPAPQLVVEIENKSADAVDCYNEESIVDVSNEIVNPNDKDCDLSKITTTEASCCLLLNNNEEYESEENSECNAKCELTENDYAIDSLEDTDQENSDIIDDEDGFVDRTTIKTFPGPKNNKKSGYYNSDDNKNSRGKHEDSGYQDDDEEYSSETSRPEDDDIAGGGGGSSSSELNSNVLIDSCHHSSTELENRNGLNDAVDSHTYSQLYYLDYYDNSQQRTTIINEDSTDKICDRYETNGGLTYAEALKQKNKKKNNNVGPGNCCWDDTDKSPSRRDYDFRYPIPSSSSSSSSSTCLSLKRTYFSAVDGTLDEMLSMFEVGPNFNNNSGGTDYYHQHRQQHQQQQRVIDYYTDEYYDDNFRLVCRNRRRATTTDSSDKYRSNYTDFGIDINNVIDDAPDDLNVTNEIALYPDVTVKLQRFKKREKKRAFFRKELDAVPEEETDNNNHNNNNNKSFVLPVWKSIL